jgi:ubiquinone/menaquinone biosynthesis C-methylase UbiE
VLGLDLSAGMLRVGGLPDVAQADMRALPLATAALDGVWCNAALLHVPLADVPGTLAEFARVVRPDGALHLTVAEGDGEGFQSDLYGGRTRWFSHHRLDPLTALLAGAGFNVHSVYRRSSHRDWLTLGATRAR